MKGARCKDRLCQDPIFIKQARTNFFFAYMLRHRKMYGFEDRRGQAGWGRGKKDIFPWEIQYGILYLLNIMCICDIYTLKIYTP